MSWSPGKPKGPEHEKMPRLSWEQQRQVMNKQQVFNAAA